MKTKLLSLAILSFILVACNSNKKADTEVLVNSTWQLTTLNGTSFSTQKEVRPVQFTLSSKDNKISGFTGCNRLMGSYELKDNTLHFSPLATTKMACPGLSFTESDILKVFEGVKTYSITEGKLSFENAKKEVIAIFTKVEKATADNTVNKKEKETTSSIVEKYWKLKTLDGKAVEMVKNQQKEIYFMLKKEQNLLTGFAGCNGFRGAYTLEANKHISFSKIAATLMACPDLDIKDADFLNVFGVATNYVVDGDHLTFKNEKGEAVASFEAVYFN